MKEFLYVLDTVDSVRPKRLSTLNLRANSSKYCYNTDRKLKTIEDIIEDGDSVYVNLENGKTVVKPLAYRPMLIEIDTSASNNNSISGYFFSNCDILIDWGDGSPVENFQGASVNVNRNYPTKGKYTISISGTSETFGSFFDFNSTSERIVDFGDLGITGLVSTFEFGYVDDLPEELPPSVITLNSCFRDSFLTEKAKESLQNWDVSNVTNFQSTFNRSRNTNRLDLSKWDVSKATTTAQMFIDSEQIDTLCLRGWKFNNCNCTSMFNNCATLSSVDATDWKFSGSCDLSDMFARCNSLKSINASSWDTSGAVNMASMFDSCYSFNDDVGGWNVSSVTNMNSMFDSCYQFNVDIGEWDVSSVTDTGFMFSNARSFNTDIGNWNTESLISAGFMFSGTPFNRDLSGWNIQSLANMSNLFSGATAFNADISSWDVSNVSDMTSMFSGATAFNADIGSWDVSSVTNRNLMSFMFANATSFDQDISGWCVTNITPEPSSFAINSPINGTAKLPVWGTCPV